MNDLPTTPSFNGWAARSGVISIAILVGAALLAGFSSAEQSLPEFAFGFDQCPRRRCRSCADDGRLTLVLDIIGATLIRRSAIPLRFLMNSASFPVFSIVLKRRHFRNADILTIQLQLSPRRRGLVSYGHQLLALVDRKIPSFLTFLPHRAVEPRPRARNAS
jgi:hypothetical protein